MLARDPHYWSRSHEERWDQHLGQALSCKASASGEPFACFQLVGVLYAPPGIHGANPQSVQGNVGTGVLKCIPLDVPITDLYSFLSHRTRHCHMRFSGTVSL